MLLAGGQGSRLYTLTEKTAKPAVPFGGKYRIIDFPMSNCVNSGIDTVGVLTQSQPLVLNEYIGNGEPWDMDRVNGGVRVLPPYQGKNGADWYKGTANAIYQHISFIDRYERGAKLGKGMMFRTIVLALTVVASAFLLVFLSDYFFLTDYSTELSGFRIVIL